MYFPKNKIETNLYSDGEFIVKSTGKVYYGLYFKTYNDEYYVGKEPSDFIQTLLPLDTSEDALDSTTDYDLRFLGKNYIYSSITNQPLKKSRLEPTPYTPQPTEEDYKRGEILRSFAKRKNGNIYYEIDQFSNLELPNNPMYLIFSIPWKISGPKEFTKEKNNTTVKAYMLEFPIPAFNQFLKNDYLKFWKPS